MHIRQVHLPFAFALTVAAAVPALAGPHVIDMRDPAGKPYRDAARALLSAIGARDAKGIDAAFAGAGDDRALLDATVATNNAASDLADALVGKFGPSAVPARDRHGFVDGPLRSVDAETIIWKDEDPDHASISPGQFPFVGFELARVDGQWRVTSVTVFPKDRPAMLDAHKQVAPVFAEMAKRVRAGEFATADAAMAAAKAKLGPIFQLYGEQTRKGRS
jgi:hypothetical protein